MFNMKLTLELVTTDYIKNVYVALCDNLRVHLGVKILTQHLNIAKWN